MFPLKTEELTKIWIFHGLGLDVIFNQQSVFSVKFLTYFNDAYIVSLFFYSKVPYRPSKLNNALNVCKQYYNTANSY